MAEGLGVDIGGLNQAWLATLRAEAARFPPGSRARGRDYAAAGNVAAVHLEGRSIHAQVKGAGIYDACASVSSRVRFNAVKPQ